MDLAQIKAWLDENKGNEDVQAYLGGLSAVSADKVKGFLDTKEGKQLIQPKLDTHFTNGLETWKKNNLSSLVEEEVKKRNPDETEEQKRIRILEEKLDEKEKESTRERLKNGALSFASEKQLPKAVLDFFIADDEEKTNANLGVLETEFNAAVQKAVDEKFKGSGRSFDQTGSSPQTESRYGKKIAEESTKANTGLEEARKSYFE